MRSLWKDERGWVIAIAAVVVLLIVLGARHDAFGAPAQKPLLNPGDAGQTWPAG